MPAELNICVACPSTDDVKAEFFMSVAAMTAEFMSKRISGYTRQGYSVHNKRGSILPQLRHELVRRAQKVGATHILFIDSDQKFPADTLRRLLAHKIPVVACNVATKSFPSNPTARQKGDDPHGSLVFTTPGKGLERVWRVGTGIMLIEMYLFSQIEPPWFMLEFNAAEDKYMGEDWWFCRLLEKLGIWVYVDHDLSLEVEHIGTCGYTHEMVMAAERMRQLEEEQQRMVQTSELIPELIPQLNEGGLGL